MPDGEAFAGLFVSVCWWNIFNFIHNISLIGTLLHEVTLEVSRFQDLGGEKVYLDDVLEVVGAQTPAFFPPLAPLETAPAASNFLAETTAEQTDASCDTTPPAHPPTQLHQRPRDGHHRRRIETLCQVRPPTFWRRVC